MQGVHGGKMEKCLGKANWQEIINLALIAIDK